MLSAARDNARTEGEGEHGTKLSQVYYLFQTLGNMLHFEIVYNYKELSTLSCRVNYVPRLVKVMNVLAKRQVKQGTETTWFRKGFTLHSCQYDSS